MTLLLAITAGTSHRAGERVIDKAARMVATRDEDGDDRMSANKCWVSLYLPILSFRSQHINQCLFSFAL